ncbi:DUF1269 domain-containing protein [Crenobacter cavernae]|uniref:DUF1269 domain-containing protein n=1 Tax=Crenobacter cavernae TaxID=2290923 RepID=A0A345Y9N7_9NEIS|nr:DUF1269 domain-containing protein [Crenobacter cavernae]AXK40639.1 DUF1269 domain-containing protein [Crenobacter cavernae]RXZ45313.1 DUF1269 domain-containing protein [Crenobacter cavernae]
MLKRKRIYYLIPDLPSAQRMMNDLLLARIEERHIHFLAREGADLSSLHRANLLQESDIVHGAEMGLAVGGATGLFAGLVAAFFMLSGSGLPWGGVVLATCLLGALFGAWTASMIGSSAPNSRLKPFRAAIERGQILLMVDVRYDQVEDIEQLLRKIHPEAHLEGTEPTIPAFP